VSLYSGANSTVKLLICVHFCLFQGQMWTQKYGFQLIHKYECLSNYWDSTELMILTISSCITLYSVQQFLTVYLTIQCTTVPYSLANNTVYNSYLQFT